MSPQIPGNFLQILILQMTQKSGALQYEAQQLLQKVDHIPQLELKLEKEPVMIFPGGSTYL